MDFFQEEMENLLICILTFFHLIIYNCNVMRLLRTKNIILSLKFEKEKSM